MNSLTNLDNFTLPKCCNFPFLRCNFSSDMVYLSWYNK